jgi:primosomal protein N'
MKMQILEKLVASITASYKKSLSKINSCPDCGFWVACPKCSAYFSKVDTELRIKEGRPIDSSYMFHY